MSIFRPSKQNIESKFAYNQQHILKIAVSMMLNSDVFEMWHVCTFFSANEKQNQINLSFNLRKYCSIEFCNEITCIFVRKSGMIHSA